MSERLLLTENDLRDLSRVSRDSDVVLRTLEGRIAVADCLEVLPLIPDESVDLIHTSPPYNIDRPYRGLRKDSSPSEAYIEFLRRVIQECKRVLRPNGSIFWQTGYTQVKNGSPGDILPIDILSYSLFREHLPLVLWDRIIWRYFGGMAFKRKFTNRHETIMWYVKPGPEGPMPSFDVDSVREQIRELDKRNNFWGRNPGNVWEVDRVAYGTTTQTSHIAVYPEEISERILRACCPMGGLVLDPFSGSGTTPKVARSLGLRWIGVEIVPEYAQEAAIRLGYQQPSEVYSLASSVVKLEVFRGRRGAMTFAEVAQRLDWWSGITDVLSARKRFDALLAEALTDGSPAKTNKRRVWELFDSWIATESPQDPVVCADRYLLADYPLRRQWNGAMRYKTALEVLEALILNLRQKEQYLIDFVTDLAINEPSTYECLEGMLVIKSPRKRIKEVSRDWLRGWSAKAGLWETTREETQDQEYGDNSTMVNEAYQPPLPL